MYYTSFRNFVCSNLCSIHELTALDRVHSDLSMAETVAF